MENVLSLLISLGDRLIGFVPGWLLRRLHPIPKLANRVVIFALGAGPHIYTKSGRPLRFTNLELMVVNPLPFPIEIQGMKLKVDLQSTYLLTVESHERTTVPKRSHTRLDLGCDLSDNQALMIRQHPTPCLMIHVSGPVSVHSRVRDFVVYFAANALAYRVPD